MPYAERRYPWLLVLTAVVAGSTPSWSGAQGREAWDVTQARGNTREIDFTTSEGTWMSMDLTPDGQWVVFGLLAHIYRVPAAGGTAESLTQNSGVAVNFQPRVSPDGRHIAFISDRRGQNNLWIMNADGTEPRPVFVNDNIRVSEPAWSADGQYIFVRRQSMAAQGEGAPGAGNGIWMYHRDGGEGVEVIGPSSGIGGPAWPSPSRDGRYLYFQANVGNTRDVVRGSVQLRRLDLATREVIAITAGEANTQIRLSSGGAFAPEVSPDGRWLAFGRRIPNAKISFKGHTYGPRTALWLRDLETGAERVAMDPVEIDQAEDAGGRALPGYAWSRDGRSLVIAQGGKIRRLDVASGEVATIPFTARVKRTISQMAAATFRQDDDRFEARFLRWQTLSPDRKTLAFQAIGRIWLMELPNGTPRRLTPDSFAPFEFAPAWSPDGQWLAFTTVDDTGRGHVWKARVGTAAPRAGAARGARTATPNLVRLTSTAAEYVHPVWSPDGREVVAVRGAGATFRGQAMMFNPWYDLVRIPEAGGAATAIVRVGRASEGDIYSFARRSILQPAFGPEGRLYYLEERQPAGTGSARARPAMYFNSVALDGKDRRSHLRFPFADEAVPSPDGKWVAFQEGDNIYITALPAGGAEEPLLVEKRRGRVPVRQVSAAGGLFPRWLDAATLEYGSGNRHFVYRVAERTTDTTTVRLTVERYKPSGTLALTGARIVTLDNRRVVENGTVIVRGNRITCAGECPVTGADRTIDVRGKTIIPGLIDMHAHHHREHRGFRPRHDFEVGVYLAFGVTTNLDNSMWSQNIFPTAELIEAGETPGPRTFSTGDPLYRGDAPRQNELTSYDVAEQNVQRLASWGAVSMKQYQQPRRDQRQWVSHAARKLGVRVTGEGGDLEYDLSMIMDGQTGWEHPLEYLPLYSDVTRFLGAARATYSVTFGVGSSVWNEEYWWGESEVWKDPRLQQWLPWRTLLPHSRRVMQRPATDYSFPILAQAVADVIAAGGNGAIGSHGQAHGIAPHWEVWMAASAMGNHGALELGSLGGARFLGMEHDLGSLASGKIADLVVLNGNPLEDIRQTANIQYVMRGGVLYESETLDEIWPRQRPFGAHPWVDPVALQTDVRSLMDHHDKAPKAADTARPRP